jgi:hypothetical protein
MKIRALLFATFVCLSCLSLSIIGQRAGGFRFHEQWWEHGWPFVWATRWGAQRDENHLVTRTSFLPLDFPHPHHFYPLAMVADLTIAILLTTCAAQLVRLPFPRGWRFSSAHLFAVCTCLGVALHLLKYFYPVLVFRWKYIYVDDSAVLAAIPGVLTGVYSTTLVMCRITFSYRSRAMQEIERPQ